jgi:hypothetical protein
LGLPNPLPRNRGNPDAGQIDTPQGCHKKVLGQYPEVASGWTAAANGGVPWPL